MMVSFYSHRRLLNVPSQRGLCHEFTYPEDCVMGSLTKRIVNEFSHTDCVMTFLMKKNYVIYSLTKKIAKCVRSQRGLLYEFNHSEDYRIFTHTEKCSIFLTQRFAECSLT